MSICPKNKSSKGRRDKRRANWKMTAPALVKCSKCGELMMPHRVCISCKWLDRLERMGRSLFFRLQTNNGMESKHQDPARSRS